MSEMSGMNKYGAWAQKHWQKHLPQRYSQLEDPNAFFIQLGEEIEEEVDAVQMTIAGSDPKGETYLQKVGRLNEARMTAESQVMQERALLDPEDDR
jgi:hypothetical protein